MSSQADSRFSGSEDAFSEIPDFTYKPQDTSTGFRKKNFNKDPSEKISNYDSEIPDDTGTRIYIGKKITETRITGHSAKTNDTKITGFSIDTDFDGTNNLEQHQEDPVSKLSETTITTLEDALKGEMPDIQQVITIEDDSTISHAHDINSSNVILNKKEKALSSNISLDISAGETRYGLPSANDKIPLGSGIITGVLGSGGMAKVYRIWNEKLEVYRAVKILIPTSQKIAWTRFLTEAKISAKLHHPNIIEVHAIGDWQGIPYIEMDEIEGETLSSLIAKFKALPSILVSAVAVQVARALAYAHCLQIVIYGKTYKGLIHRDLKPSNIMVGKDGIVKLMDFGVARPVETGLHTIDTENIVGTIHYFSPEQISGYPIDTLSDIYSFGAVIYEMIGGVNPFPYSSMIQLVRAKEKNQFARLEEFAKPIDPRLASVAHVCLRTDKNARYQSAAELCKQLEKIHQISNVGSPEEIVRMFVQNPQKVYKDSEYVIKQFTPEIITAKQQPISEAQNDKVLIDEMRPGTTPNSKATDYKTIIKKSEYLREKSKRKSIVLIVTVIVILLTVAGLLCLNKTKSESGNWFETGSANLQSNNDSGIIQRGTKK